MPRKNSQGKLIIHCINSFHIYRLIVFDSFKSAMPSNQTNQTRNIIKGIKHFCHVFTVGACARFPRFFCPASQIAPPLCHQILPHPPLNSYTFSNSLKLSLSVSVSILYVCLLNVVYELFC